jgi:RNA polymerase sigma-70 factor (ECF subfamily)
MPMGVVDQRLLSRLLDEHGAALVLYAQQWCSVPEDVVQEAFIRLMQQPVVPDNLVGWLYRVIRNVAISTSRASGRRTRHEAAAAARCERWFQPATDDAIDAAAARDALETLPIDEREVIVLRLWSGLSFEEIANLAGTSISTAHRRYEKGLRALQANWSVPCPNPKICD